jgi:hypothetical protein
MPKTRDEIKNEDRDLTTPVAGQTVNFAESEPTHCPPPAPSPDPDREREVNKFNRLPIRRRR